MGSGIRFGLGATVMTMMLSLGFIGCGGESDLPRLSTAGRQGRDLAEANGCLSCHGSQGQGGVGPKWTGLVGSEVHLSDGTTVIADTDYLKRAIVDPTAQKVEGYTVQMPAAGLDDDEVEAIVTYIGELP